MATQQFVRAYEKVASLSVIVGCVILGCYGLVVNSIHWDFGKLLGVYVAVFALVSVLWGRYVMKEVIAPSTVAGVLIIMA